MQCNMSCAVHKTPPKYSVSHHPRTHVSLFVCTTRRNDTGRSLVGGLTNDSSKWWSPPSIQVDHDGPDELLSDNVLLSLEGPWCSVVVYKAHLRRSAHEARRHTRAAHKACRSLMAHSANRHFCEPFIASHLSPRRFSHLSPSLLPFFNAGSLLE